MEKLDMQSMNVTAANVEKIAALFPSCVTERLNSKGVQELAIDLDKLRMELGADVLDETEERYQFTWPDKREAIRLSNARTTMTLRPCREESVDFDNTENLYIEGDNLEVLKVLQQNYLGKVKMIYIDPPYNTGSDFVYKDKRVISADDYTSMSGQFDEEGNQLVKNTESNGRFHTDWLNFIYPRLKVARNLLSKDGVIFISIDDNEEENLKKICDEIYGESNHIGTIANTNNPKGRSDDKYIATAHEYILVYARNIDKVDWYGFEPTEEIIKRYNKIDENGKKYREIDLRKTGENDLREDRPNLFYYFIYNQETKEFYPSRESLVKEGYITIKPQREDGKEGNWRWGIDTACKQIADLVPKFMPSRKVWGVMQKDYLEGRSLVKPTSSWTFKDVNSERGTEQFVELDFDKRIFPKPKPLGTIKRCIILGCSKDSESIVLDFFSGSATTAQALMQLNAEDEGNRRFILVQLPENTEEKSYAFKAGYKNICEIGKERIRRAGSLIKEDNPNVDTGFRVLKLDKSNMKDVYYTPSEVQEQDLWDSLSNIKEDRTPEDLLFQVMPECGVKYSEKIEVLEIAGKKVFSVMDNYLAACFDEKVNEEIITAIAKTAPTYFVMRDSSLESDNVADNFMQIFKQYSPETTCKII